jgi:hypothetical protein
MRSGAAHPGEPETNHAEDEGNGDRAVAGLPDLSSTAGLNKRAAITRAKVAVYVVPVDLRVGNEQENLLGFSSNLRG